MEKQFLRLYDIFLFIERKERKMEGKKITLENGLTGAMNFFSSLAMGGPRRDLNALNTVLPDGITVDTCFTSDTGFWETGIERKKIENNWVIVSQYESEAEAKLGHEGWVKLMTDDPTAELKDINMWNLESL
jgi:hypothetical protein